MTASHQLHSSRTMAPSRHRLVAVAVLASYTISTATAFTPLSTPNQRPRQPPPCPLDGPTPSRTNGRDVTGGTVRYHDASSSLSSERRGRRAAKEEPILFDPFHLASDGSGPKIKNPAAIPTSFGSTTRKASSQGKSVNKRENTIGLASWIGGNNNNNSNNDNEDEKRRHAVMQARVLLLVAAALYGTNFTMVKLLDETVPTGMSTMLRFALATLATLPWLLAPDNNKTTSSAVGDGTVSLSHDPTSSPSSTSALTDGTWPVLLAGLEVGAYNSVGYLAQAVGLETTDASKSAFICSLAVVVVPILDYVLSKKTLRPRQIIGALLAVAGVGFLEFGGAGGTATATAANFPDLISAGDLLTLLQPLAFGMAFWRMEHACAKFPDQATRLTAAQILAVFLSSAAYTLFGEHATVTWTQLMEWVSNPSILGAIFWTGCITTALTLYMETLALKTLSAAETTLIFSTEPLWGAAFASLVVGEQLGLGAGLGAAFILGGCLFSNLGGSVGESTENVNKAKDGGAASKGNSSRGSATSKSSLPKTLVGPGLTLATPAAAVAKAATDLAEDASSTAAAVAEIIQENLGGF